MNQNYELQIEKKKMFLSYAMNPSFSNALFNLDLLCFSKSAVLNNCHF